MGRLANRWGKKQRDLVAMVVEREAEYGERHLELRGICGGGKET